MTDGCWRSTLKSMLLIYGVVAIVVLVRLISRGISGQPQVLDRQRADRHPADQQRANRRDRGSAGTAAAHLQGSRIARRPILAAAGRADSGQQPPRPAQAATVSPTVSLLSAVPKPKLRLATNAQLLLSSTLFHEPRVNLYWNAAVGTPVMVSVQVPVPVWTIG